MIRLDFDQSSKNTIQRVQQSTMYQIGGQSKHRGIGILHEECDCQRKKGKKNQSSLNAGIYQGKGSFQIMFGGFCPWNGVGGLPQSPPKKQ